jgi:hypothetical protein
VSAGTTVAEPRDAAAISAIHRIFTHKNAD